jgi:uncharacterized membrane protein
MCSGRSLSCGGTPATSSSASRGLRSTIILAAVQAPNIMMSQSRQEAKDRLRSQHDYQVNLKAEIEIRHLHEKMDHLLRQQWERLAQIQEIQLELLSELGRRDEA